MHLILAINISSFLQIFVLVSFAKNSEYLRLATAKLCPAKLYPQKHNTLSRAGFEPRALAPKSSALTTRPLRLSPLIDYALIFKLLRNSTFTWWARGLSCWLKKLTCFLYQKKYYFNVLSSSIEKFSLSWQNSVTDHLVTDVCVSFRPPCWWAPAWRVHTNLYKFE